MARREEAVSEQKEGGSPIRWDSRRLRRAEIVRPLSAISYTDPTGATSATRSSERAIGSVDMLANLLREIIQKYIVSIAHYV